MFVSSFRNKTVVNFFMQFSIARTMSSIISTPRRALMYVPASDPRKIKKAQSIQADFIVLDCEDGVSMNQKDSARKNIADLLNESPFPCHRPQWGVRVNSVSSGLCQLDLNTIFAAANKPPSILLPKVENIDEISWFSDAVRCLNIQNVQMDMIIYSETAGSLLKLPEIIQAAIETVKKGSLKLVALVLGSDDYVANIGATRTKSCLEVLYARQRLVMIAKAFDLQAIDMVHIDIKDLDELRKTSLESAAWGFTGRQVIHPSHVAIVQEAYSPSQSRIDWASGLVKAFNIHQQQGKGAFVYAGQMIDMPTLRQAQNVVNIVKESTKQ